VAGTPDGVSATAAARGSVQVNEASRIDQPARLESLTAFAKFIDDACAHNGADHDTTHALRLAVEEVCTNVIKYGYAGMEPGSIALTFEAPPGRFVITVSDRGRPFDPRSAPPPDLTSSAEERPIGGLGVYLVNAMMDEVSYRSDPVCGNTLTLVKLRRTSAS
jgi:serine/threonine-protein kinase RsbW